jgi:hypothetical protein
MSHPRIAERALEGPVKVADQHHVGNAIYRTNARLAIYISNSVGTMWCAYVFMILACISFPAALASGSALIMVAWVAQTFLQLVLLPVIMVGQSLQSRAADKRSEQMYFDTDAILHQQQTMLQEHHEIRLQLDTVKAILTGEQH